MPDPPVRLPVVVAATPLYAVAPPAPPAYTVATPILTPFATPHPSPPPPNLNPFPPVGHAPVEVVAAVPVAAYPAARAAPVGPVTMAVAAPSDEPILIEALD